MIWKGVETVLRHMIGLLDKIDAGVEGLHGSGTDQIARALHDNAAAIDQMRKHLREGMARLDHQLVLYASQSTAQQQDLRRQMRALEGQVAALVAAQRPQTSDAVPDWVEGMIRRIEDRMAERASSEAQERIADLELQLSALQRQGGDAAHPASAPLDGAAQEIRLLLAELIAIQEREQSEGRSRVA